MCTATKALKKKFAPRKQTSQLEENSYVSLNIAYMLSTDKEFTLLAIVFK